MKRISLVVVAFVLFSSTSIFANDNPPVDGEEIGQKIEKLLEDNSFTSNDVNLTADVRFTLNDKGEIVVLSVSTESNAFEAFVKNKLNYQSVEITNYKEGRIYTVPVRVEVEA